METPTGPKPPHIRRNGRGREGSTDGEGKQAQKNKQSPNKTRVMERLLSPGRGCFSVGGFIGKQKGQNLEKENKAMMGLVGGSQTGKPPSSPSPVLLIGGQRECHSLPDAAKLEVWSRVRNRCAGPGETDAGGAGISRV